MCYRRSNQQNRGSCESNTPLDVNYTCMHVAYGLECIGLESHALTLTVHLILTESTAIADTLKSHIAQQAHISLFLTKTQYASVDVIHTSRKHKETYITPTTTLRTRTFHKRVACSV